MTHLHLVFHFLLISICGITCLQRPILTSQKIVEIANNNNKLFHYGNDLEVNQNWSIDQVSKMIIKGLSNNILEWKYKLMTQSSTTFLNELSDKMDDFVEGTNYVEDLYMKFSYMYIHYNAYTKLNKSEEKLQYLSTKYLLNDSVKLEMKMNRMDEALIGSDTEGKNLATIISRSLPSDTMNADVGSPQQIIHKLYAMSVLTHTKALLIVLYALDLKEQFEKVDLENEKQNEINKYYSSINSVFEKVKQTMGVASRELWTFDPVEHVDGLTYSTLHPIFQGYLIPDVDNFNHSLIKSCDAFNGNKLICSSDSCKSQIEDKKCRGVLRNCQSADSNIHICYSTDPGRKYNWMKTKEGILYGRGTKSCWRFETQRSSQSFGNCRCTCESGFRHVDRYFSLLDVVSNVDLNKVVTGARIVQYGNIFYIQIQQGTLGKNGTIIDRTTGWKPVNKNQEDQLWTDYVATYNTEFIRSNRNAYNDGLVDWKDNKLVYVVREGRDTVYLDNIEGRKNDLVTGLRFEQDGSGLKLAIRLTKFNYLAGQLYNESNLWISTTVGNRTELVLDEPDVPIKAPVKMDTFSQNNQYLRFRMTDFKKDLGQNTIPFIDVQPVVTNPPSPLAGAGIFHKATNHYGGFLALKLIHLDFSAYF